MFLPIIFGVLALGLGFSRHHLRPTHYYIYDQDDLAKKIQVISNSSVESQFLVPSSNSEVNKFYNLETEFAIKSKHGEAFFNTYSNMLSQEIDREKTIEILLSVRVNVESRTFPSNTKFTSLWILGPQELVGTHFVKSLQYGGQFLGSYRITATKPEYAKDIKAAVQKFIGKTGTISNIRSGNIEQLEDEVRGKAVRSVQIQSSPPLSIFPITTFVKLVQEAKRFPGLIQTLDRDKIFPVAMELVDMHILAQNFSEFRVNTDLKPILKEVDEKYDDLRIAYKEFHLWDYSRDIYTTENELLIEDYQDRLQKAEKAMSIAISFTNMTGSTQQFDKAFQEYGVGAQSNKYIQELKNLIKTVEGGKSRWMKKLVTSFPVSY